MICFARSPLSKVWNFTEIIFGASDWGWEPSESDVSALQMKLLGRYDAWTQRVRLLFPHPTPHVEERLAGVDEFARRWIGRPDTYDHDIPQTIELAKVVASRKLDLFDELLDIAEKSGTDELRLIPDTNALLRNPDLASYERVINAGFRVHLVPTVLKELDELKDRGKSPELRNSAQSVVRRLKGFRDRGDVASGVKVTKTITVQFDAREVGVASVLDWLDPSVADDRILAAALKLQSEHPGGTVVLVTSDLNLQNKADAVGLPYLETPPALSTLRARLTATLDWIEDAPPRITISNSGPAVARDLTYLVETPDGQTGMRSTAGPWTVKALKVGESNVQDVYGVFGEVVHFEAEWEDDEGPQQSISTLDFPAPPAGRSPQARSNRPRR